MALDRTEGDMDHASMGGWIFYLSPLYKFADEMA